MTIPDIQTVTSESTEESAATAGMSYIGTGVFPDRSATMVHGTSVTVRLSFNA